jgi:hypothetical protein
MEPDPSAWMLAASRHRSATQCHLSCEDSDSDSEVFLVQTGMVAAWKAEDLQFFELVFV